MFEKIFKITVDDWIDSFIKFYKTLQFFILTLHCVKVKVIL